jgi:hypothetical protein
MGNCECLRPEKDQNEINVHFKARDFNDDYESTTKGKARAGNNPFSMIDDDEEAAADRNKLKSVEEIEDQEPPVREGTFVAGTEEEHKPFETKEHEQENQPLPVEEEDDFQVTFKKEATLTNKEKAEVYVVSHAIIQESAPKEPIKEELMFEPNNDNDNDKEKDNNAANQSYISDSDVEGGKYILFKILYYHNSQLLSTLLRYQKVSSPS